MMDTSAMQKMDLVVRYHVEGLGLQSAAGGWDCCGTGIAVPCRGQGLFMIGDSSPEPKKGTDRDLRTGYG